MNKKFIIILSIILVAILLFFAILMLKNRTSNSNNIDNDSSSIYDKDENVISYVSSNKKPIGIIENTKIQGIVELNHNGYIYIFNGQHFGEYGFEMEEYTSANIDNKNQECIDYITATKHDTSYIQEGDVLICSGDLIEYSIGNYDLDTKNNPIIVLKLEDYNKMKKEYLMNNKSYNAIVGEYFDSTGELYIKYNFKDNDYKLPFVLKFNIKDNVKVIGNISKGKKLKIQYKDINTYLEKIEIKTIEVIE